jgi:hypothetical protein
MRYRRSACQRKRDFGTILAGAMPYMGFYSHSVTDTFQLYGSMPGGHAQEDV